MRHLIRTGLAAMALVSLFSLHSCGKEQVCKVSFGATNFSIEPNSARYSSLNTVGGYVYLTGGHRGVVVVRTAWDQFLAYDRTCPHDNSSTVKVSDDWGSALLECPNCHSRFVVESDGMPIDGSATPCPLYQYSTTYTGGVLYVY